jgi:hypothetical protein
VADFLSFIISGTFFVLLLLSPMKCGSSKNERATAQACLVSIFGDIAELIMKMEEALA